ncbi:MAG: DUF1818 family protein [Cyanobacteria bacterium P01_G01_bin.54]
MPRILKTGPGWRVGWHSEQRPYCALVGAEDWAIELTEPEFADFCRLLNQLAETMSQMAAELMAEERIACEAESERLWLEVEGFPDAYDLRLMVKGDRRCEGNWATSALPGLLQGLKMLQVF